MTPAPGADTRTQEIVFAVDCSRSMEIDDGARNLDNSMRSVLSEAQKNLPEDLRSRLRIRRLNFADEAKWEGPSEPLMSFRWADTLPMGYSRGATMLESLSREIEGAPTSTNLILLLISDGNVCDHFENALQEFEKICGRREVSKMAIVTGPAPEPDFARAVLAKEPYDVLFAPDAAAFRQVLSEVLCEHLPRLAEGFVPSGLAPSHRYPFPVAVAANVSVGSAPGYLVATSQGGGCCLTAMARLKGRGSIPLLQVKVSAALTEVLRSGGDVASLAEQGRNQVVDILSTRGEDASLIAVLAADESGFSAVSDGEVFMVSTGANSEGKGLTGQVTETLASDNRPCVVAICAPEFRRAFARTDALIAVFTDAHSALAKGAEREVLLGRLEQTVRTAASVNDQPTCLIATCLR